MDSWLNKGSIRRVTLAASIIPALLMFLILTPSFLIERTNDAELNLQTQGNLLIKQLSHVSEYALLTGNTKYLSGILEDLLAQPDIYSITVRNTANKILLKKKRADVNPSDSRLIVFEQPVLQNVDSSTFDIIEGVPFSSGDPESMQKPFERTIGYVKLTLTTQNLNQQQLNIITYGLLLAIVALTLSALVGKTIGRSIVNPIQSIIAGVNRLSGSNYTSPIGQVSNNELGALANDIDALATQLNQAKMEIDNTINKLIEARDQADRANASKSDFLALISHEIRSPLNSAFGVIQLLEDTKLSKPQQRYIELAINSFNHLVNLLDDIIDFSTIEYGEIKIERQPTNVKKLINQVIDNHKLSAQQKQLDLSVQFHGDIELQQADIHSDPTRLRQILSNLVDNAIKYTSHGGVYIHTTWMWQDDNNIVISIKVQDTGMGIPQDQLKTIFNMFTQGASPSVRGYGGVGLGLYIVKRLVKLLGGYINVRSQEGIGSLFAIELPARMIQNAVTENFSVEPISNFESYSGNILVVEDDYANQQVIVGFLNQVGITVDIANNGIEGLQKFKTNSYNLIFVDCYMPDMDGFELAAKMREFENTTSKIRTPIIAITASALASTRQQCLQAGMDDIITKPYRKFELYKRISAICKTGKILTALVSNKTPQL